MHIDDYRFGMIVIDGRRYAHDVLVLPDQIISPWWRRNGHVLDIADLDAVLTDAPDLLIVGTGASGCLQVPQETLDELYARGIAVKSMPSPEAVEAFNRWAGNGRTVAAGIHLTC